jgi:hypothetical protein
VSILQPVDPNERFKLRRQRARRRLYIRRTIAGAFILGAVSGLALGIRVMADRGGGTEQVAQSKPSAKPKTTAPVKQTREMPYEVRGVHVTMALASIPGKIDEYLKIRGLNTIELDVKDENGEVAFSSRYAPLAAKISARDYYNPKQAVQKMRRSGVYLIGRVVVFEDPVLAENRPELAVKRPDGSIWLNHAGLGWSNPYDERVWDYNVDVAESAARAGFDEIQFDYVRFPSDGDLTQIVYPGKTGAGPGWVIAQFLQYASKRLKPLGVRVSADVFGLSATRDMGIGQIPKRIASYLDAIYPMVYPSHYSPGEFNIPDPNASPGETVRNSMIDFNQQLRGKKTLIIPWLQDFSLGRTYTIADIEAQIEAARLTGARGFMLWNAAGVYTEGALAVE